MRDIGRGPGAHLSPPPRSSARRSLYGLLGLDPGSRRTGFGVIECRGSELIAVAHGCLNLAAAAPAARLRMIFEGLRALMSQHQPAEVAVERVFRQPQRRQRLEARAGTRRGAVRHPRGRAGV